MKSKVVRVLFALGFLVAAYVLYAHAASLHAAYVKARSSPWTTRFSEPSAFKGEFDVEPGVGLTYEPNVGAVNVLRHKGAPPAGQILFRSHPLHFDGGMARARFKLGPRGAYDVFLGLEYADRPEKHVWLVLRNDAQKPSFRLEGADSLRGPTPMGEPLLQYVEGDQVVRDNGDGHTLGLLFEPVSQTLEVFIDDVPVASRLLGWTAGFDARIVFGVRDREDADIDVNLQEVSWLPGNGRPPAHGADFSDEFLGSRLDPLRWQAFFQQEWRTDGNLKTLETGDGLLLNGRGTSQSAPGISTPVEVCTMPFALTPLRIETEWDVRDLDHASAFISIRNLIATRAIDIELANTDAKGTKRLRVKGQLDGKLDAEETEGPEFAPAHARLYATYDPWLRTLRVSNEDVKVFEHSYGLRREEFVRVCVGTHVFPNGHSEVLLRRIFLHRAPY